jgi:hypothetical protein
MRALARDTRTATLLDGKYTGINKSRCKDVVKSPKPRPLGAEIQND